MKNSEPFLEYDSTYSGVLQSDINELSQKLHVCSGSPKVREVENGLVLPRRAASKMQPKPYQGRGGVLDSDNRFIKESAIYDLEIPQNKFFPYAFGGEYDFDEGDYVDDEVVYLGLAHQHWGHFLLDIVQRLWICIDNPEYLNSKKFVFSAFQDNIDQWNSPFSDFFNFFGITTDKIEIVTVPTRFRNVIVPDVAVYPGKFIYPQFQEIFQRVVNTVMQTPSALTPIEKVYFSRLHLKSHKDIGENLIQKEFEESGFTVLFPEELTLREQIFYWQTSTQIACVNGTIPHNCVFGGQKVRLIILAKMRRMVGYQFTMDLVRGVPSVYVSCYKEPFRKFPISVSRGPFWIVVNQNVRNLLNLEDGQDTLHSMEDAMKYAIQCVIAEARYQLRGSGARIRKLTFKMKGH